MRQATRIALRRCHFGREDARASVVLGQSHGLCNFEIRSWRRMNSLTAQRLLQRRFISSVAATASSGCHDTLRNAAHGATERLARIPHLLHQFGHLEEGGRKIRLVICRGGFSSIQWRLSRPPSSINSGCCCCCSLWGGGGSLLGSRKAFVLCVIDATKCTYTH